MTAVKKNQTESAWESPVHLGHRLRDGQPAARQPGRSLAGQRVLGILLGHEDLSDHEELRKDPAVGSVLGRLETRRADCAPLAGKSTLNRFELSAAGVNPWKARKIAADFEKMDRLMADLFIEKHAEPPEEIVIDLDATDFESHGGQERRFYHGHCEYAASCTMPNSA